MEATLSHASSTHVRAGAHWQRATFLFLSITTFLRLLQLPALELAPDEAYYWDWSRRLAPGYYDQGPFIAYLIRITTAIFGTNELGVRSGVLACSVGTQICCYLLARRLYGPQAGFLTVLLLGVTPFVEIGSIVATYDPPLVFFWAFTVLCLQRALFAPDPAVQRRAWLHAGVTTGLGFLSKHTMLLIVVCLLTFFALAPEYRTWLRRPEPYQAFLIVIVLYSGVIWWNAHHHWWTFGHLLFLSRKAFGTPVSRLGEFIASQALLLGPVLFLAVLRACIRHPVSNPRADTSPSPHRTSLFLFCMGLPVFFLFCLLALKAKVQANWAPYAWLTPAVLLAGQLTHLPAPALRRQTTLIVASSGILTLLMVSPELRYRLGIRLSVLADHTNTMYGWRETAARLQQIREEMQRQGRTVFIASDGYQFTALMAFYLPDHPPTYDLFLHGRLTMYAAHVQDLKARLGQDAIFINSNRSNEGDLKQLFERVEWEAEYPIWRRPYYRAPIRRMQFARCYRYHRYVGLQWAVGG